jgi:hypothetical protein
VKCFQSLIEVYNVFVKLVTEVFAGESGAARHCEFASLGQLYRSKKRGEILT